MARVCLRENRAPGLLVRVKAELPSSSRVLLLDYGMAFFMHFSRGFWYTRGGLYSRSEVLGSLSGAAEVGQTGAGPLLTLGSSWQVRLGRRSWHKVVSTLRARGSSQCYGQVAVFELGVAAFAVAVVVWSPLVGPPKGCGVLLQQQLSQDSESSWQQSAPREASYRLPAWFGVRRRKGC